MTIPFYKPAVAPLGTAKGKPYPQTAANPLSRLFFHWLSPLLKIGYSRPLEQDDLWEIPDKMKCAGLADAIDQNYTKRLPPSKRGANPHEDDSPPSPTDAREREADRMEVLADFDHGMDALELTAQLTRDSTRQHAETHPGASPKAVDEDVKKVHGNRTAAKAAKGLVAVEDGKVFDQSLFKAMYHTVAGEVWICIALIGTGYIGRICSPLLTRQLITRIGAGGGVGEMFAFAVGNFGLLLMASWLEFHSDARTVAIGMRLRGAVIDLISRKSMRLSNKARVKMTSGRINTMISADASYLDWLVMQLVELVVLVPQILVGIGLLISILGYSGLVGLGVLVLSAPFQWYMFRRMFRYRDAQQKLVDQRVRILSEVIGSIRAVKLYAYESYFSDKISQKRREELAQLQQNGFSRALTTATMAFVPVLASILSLITYALSGNVLEPGIIFASLQFFNLLKNPIAFIPMALATIADAKSALLRIGEMLRAEEQVLEVDIDLASKFAIDIDAAFEYEASAKEVETDKPHGIRQRLAAIRNKPKTSVPAEAEPTTPFSLPGVQLMIPHGALVCIVGRVGVGKTALLSAMINALRKTKGHIKFGGQISYVPQHAWIQSGSIRRNITFSHGEGDVGAAIEACALQADLDRLPEGVDTEIGEKGITLSGGQRQRICIARAVYDDAEIVLLDDPLSAVDPTVGQHLIHRCIVGGPLSKRTRVLVTHQLDVLPLADLILVMDREGTEGRIVQQGSYDDLLAKPGLFRDLIQDYGSAASEAPSQETVRVKEAEQVVGGKLALDEERETGEIGWGVYSAWFKAARSWALLGVIGLTLVLAQVATVGSSLWLAFWSQNTFALSQGQYIGIYGGIGVSVVIIGFIAAYSLIIAGLRASRTMFESAWRGVMKSPATWHDRTPSGRVISRLSKDVAQLDDKLTSTWNQFITNALGVLGTFGLIAYTYPWLCLVFVPLLSYIYLATAFYRKSSREVKRVESVVRSHVYSSFAEQLAGVDVIKAFNCRPRFEKDLQTAVDRQNDAHLVSIVMMFWLNMRLSTLSLLLSFLVMVFGIVFRDSVDPARFGVTLVYTLATAATMQNLAILFAKCEQEMNHVERVKHFGELEQEATAYRSTDPDNWPIKGEIAFQNVQLQYRPDLPTVLKGLSFAVKAGEKVGIIGRTGAGKSSIVQALYRTVEISGRRIEIDGVDLAGLGLETLRGRLSIIPQDSFLFEGSVRENIDPAGLRSDAELDDALNLIQSSNSASESLKAKFRLDAEVHAEGANFSAGERQLLALMRALARRSKVLVLDEATSSVDPETDALIQRIIQTEFAEVTLLSIAHRLQTVVYYDRILVLEAGVVAEFDTPLALFDQAESIFRGLCDVKRITREEIVKIRSGAL